MSNKEDCVLGCGIRSRLVWILEHRRLPAILCSLALVATLPALGTGLLNDDFCHWGLLAGPSGLGDDLSDSGIVTEESGRLSAALSELFAPVDPDRNLAALRSYGAIPWWTYDGLRVRFWRPLSSLTHWLDYRVFGDSAVAMHAHNLVWLAAVMFLVTTLYRRLMAPAWIAGLAAMVYVVDDFSYFPAMWIANRNIFLSLFFGILSVLGHHRWRRGGSWAAGAGSVLCLAGSLLSAEAGVATFAYLFAYAMILDEASRVRRVVSLVPAVLVTVLWRIVYNMLGYGASGGSFYSDPSREPLRYAWAMLVRGPILIMREWCGIPADIFSYTPDSTTMLFWPVVVAFVVVVVVVLLPLLRVNRLARFWLVGMHLSVLPICATMPMNRNLLFVGIGACGLIGQFIAGLLAKESWVPKRRVRRALAWGLCILLIAAHLPCALATRIAAPLMTSKIVGKVRETMEIGSPEGLAEQDLVVVNAPNPASFLYIPLQQAHKGEALPRAVRILAPGFGQLEVVRKDEKSLMVRAQSGNLLSCQSGHVLDMAWVYLFEAVSTVRSADNALRRGQRIELPRMSVEVVDVDGEGMPVEVLFEFAVSLEHESLRWLQWNWKKDRYDPFEVPAVGQRVNVRGPF